MSVGHNVLVASFDHVPRAKGASQHILRNVEMLSVSHRVRLLTLGRAPVAGVRHIVARTEETNWLRRALWFGDFCARAHANYPETTVLHARSPFEILAAPPSLRVVYEVNGLMSFELLERYPDVATSPSFLERVRLWEDAAFDRAEVLLTPSPVTASYLEGRTAGGRPVHVVPNAPSFVPADPATIDGPTPSAEGVRLVYIGSLSSWQGLPVALKALSRWDAAWRLDVFTGAGAKERRRLIQVADALGVGERVVLRDAVSHRELAATLQMYDVALAPLVPSGRNLIQGCMPVKLLDYLASGIAVVAPDMPVVRHVMGDDYPLYVRYNLASMLERVQQYAADPAYRLETARRGLLRVNTTFRAADQAAALHAVYDAL